MRGLHHRDPGVVGAIMASDQVRAELIADGVHVHDFHATIMHLLGLDSHRLEIPGRQRLAIDHGTPIRAIMA